MKNAPGIEALRGASQEALVRVDVHASDGTKVVDSLPVAGGYVRGSSLRIGRWQGSLDVADLEYVPTAATDYLSGLSGHYVSVYKGVRPSGDDPLWVHLADLWPVESTTLISKEEGTFQVRLESAAYLAEAAGGLVHTPAEGETAQDFAARILTERLPYTPTVTDTSTPFAVPASYEPDDSPVFLVVEEMMSLASARLFFDATGGIVIRPALGGIDVEPPVLDGSYAVDVTQYDVTVGRARFYNDVVVRFRGTDQQLDETVGRAWVNDGPLRRDGPAGRSTYTLTLDVTATATQANAFARRVLKAQIHTWTSTSLTAVPDPRVEPTDTVRLTYLDGRVLLQRVVGVEHDLGTGPMRLTARTALPETPVQQASDGLITSEAEVAERKNVNIWVPTVRGTSVEGDFGVFGESNLGNAMASGLQVDGQASVTSLEVNTPEGSTRAQINLGNDYRIQRLIATDGKRYLWVSPIASDLVGAGSYTIGPTASGDIDAQIRLRAESVQLEHQGWFTDFNSEWKAITPTNGFVDYGGSYAMRYRVAGNVLYLDGLLKGYLSGGTFGFITETGIGGRLPYNTLLNCQHSNSGMIRVDVTKVSSNQLRLALTSSSGGILGNAPISTGFINLNNAIPLAKGFGYPPTGGGSGGSGGGSLTTYTTTFPATWWRAYQSNNTPRTDSHSHIYQGRYSSFWGNLRSLVGYNVSVPAGAKAVSGYMTIDWEHWYYGSGGTAYFYPHAHASAPSTFSVQSNTAWTYKFSTANPGAINVPLPANIVTQLLSGYTKGITVGPAPSDSLSYYGYAKPTPSITLRYQA